MVAAHALDTFYDIYAEAYYNEALASMDVVALMSAGQPGLSKLYYQAKQAKSLSKS